MPILPVPSASLLIHMSGDNPTGESSGKFRQVTYVFTIERYDEEQIV